MRLLIQKKFVLLGALIAFALNGIACGKIQVPMNLGVQNPGSEISLTLVNPPLGPLGTSEFQGGVSTVMTMDIGLFDVLFHLPFSGVIEITDLLFGGSSINILGTDTGTLCTVLDPDNPGGGTALVDIYHEQVTFNMDAGTLILPTNPSVAALLPNGFPFAFSFSDTMDLSLADLLGLAFGSADGALTITQPLDDTINVTLLGIPLEIGVTGQLVLSTVNELPGGDLIDICNAFLAGP